MDIYHNRQQSNSREDLNSEDENSKDLENNRVIKLINQHNSQDNTKNLYENIGQRVLKIRDENDLCEKKIIQTENEIKLLKERIQVKKNLLENTMQGHKKTKNQIKLHDREWMAEFYNEQLTKRELKMKINSHHIINDPELYKAEKKRRTELSTLQNSHNSYMKKIEEVKNDVDVLRKENNKLKSNLASIGNNKEKQNKEMNKMSEEANQYLQKKGIINKELIEINQRIEIEKVEHEAKMKELNKMIDNTRKIKQFNETLAIEKFSTHKRDSKPTHKITVEKEKLDALDNELLKSKRITVYLTFKKLLLLKKQGNINTIIAKVKRETGIDNLVKLNSDLELSKETNLKFDNDLKELYKKKKEIEKDIERKREEINQMQDILNDNHSIVEQHILKLKNELEESRQKKKKLDQRYFGLNRLIDLIATIFKSFRYKLSRNDRDFSLESLSNEEILMHCMEFFENKMVDIIQMNVDPSNTNEQNEIRLMNLYKKLMESINHEDHDKMFDKKNVIQANFNLEKVNGISQEMVNSYVKKFESNK